MNIGRFDTKAFLYAAILYLVVLSQSACKGTIETVTYVSKNIRFKRAYIIAPQRPTHYKFVPTMIPAYFWDESHRDALYASAEKIEVVGKTEKAIREELEEYGISAVIGTSKNAPEGFDIIVKFNESWTWDMTNILDHLEIIFISCTDGKEIGRSIYRINDNSEMHNFPTPRKEVPNMIRELMARYNSFDK
jgi:hypothetical protein